MYVLTLFCACSSSPAKSLDGEVKLQMEWYPFLADHNSFAFKSIANTIAKAVSIVRRPLTGASISTISVSQRMSGLSYI